MFLQRPTVDVVDMRMFNHLAAARFYGSVSYCALRVMETPRSTNDGLQKAEWSGGQNMCTAVT